MARMVIYRLELLNHHNKEITVLFRQLIDAETSTYTYLLADQETKEAVLIDTVREQFSRDSQIIDELGLKLVYTLETHVHADHVTSSGLFREKRGSKTVISKESGVECADILVSEGHTIHFGKQSLIVMETPGHTDTCVTYVLADKSIAFTGDALLIRGCGRTDFQQGSPQRLFHSIREKVFQLPDKTLLFPGHDYKGRTVTTVGEEKKHNNRLRLSIELDEFIGIMDGLNLSYPKRIDVALPANLKCGAVVKRKKEPISPSSEDAWAPIIRRGSFAEVLVSWVQEQPAGVVLIDVRRVDEFHGALPHISGAHLYPLASLSEEMEDWDRETKIVTICRSGKRSLQAATILNQMGFAYVASMRGGMMAYHKKES
jgi:sulfur dioxygenase